MWIKRRCVSGLSNWLIKNATNPDPQRTQTIEGAISGILLFLATIAAIAMAWTRLQADVDQPTFEEMLVAIDENLIWYHWHGTMRVLFGGLLIAAASLMGPAMASAQGWQLRGSGVLLGIGGIAMLLSGVLVIFVGSVYWSDTFEVEQIDSYRSLSGNIGNTAIGLAIILMTPIQWRLGGMMKFLSGLAPLSGLGMVIVWWDASSVHQISGVLFLLWMLGTSISLMFGWFGHQKHNDPSLTLGQARKLKY